MIGKRDFDFDTRIQATAQHYRNRRAYSCTCVNVGSSFRIIPCRASLRPTRHRPTGWAIHITEPLRQNVHVLTHNNPLLPHRITITDHSPHSGGGYTAASFRERPPYHERPPPEPCQPRRTIRSAWLTGRKRFLARSLTAPTSCSGPLVGDCGGALDCVGGGGGFQR